jgi:hypothetical protein
MGDIRLPGAARWAPAATAVVIALTAPGPAQAEDVITIKERRLEPPAATVPAGQRITLAIANQEPTPEELEGHELREEKVIPGGASIPVGPLKADTYPFFGEINESTAKNKLIAK